MKRNPLFSSLWFLIKALYGLTSTHISKQYVTGLNLTSISNEYKKYMDVLLSERWYIELRKHYMSYEKVNSSSVNQPLVYQINYYIQNV